MGSSSISYTSNLILAKRLSGTESHPVGGNVGSAEILPEESQEGIIIALVNVTSSFAQQTVGTPVIVRNLHVFANGVRLGDIPPLPQQTIKNGAHGIVYNVNDGLVYIYL